MNASSLSVIKARALAANRRLARRPVLDHDTRPDRDLARVAYETSYLAQTAAPRVL